MKTKRLISVLLILTMFLNVAGCATPKNQLPDVPVQDISRYKAYQNQNDIHVAIDPFYDQQKLFQFFGTDLIYYGILPIHIVIENKNVQPLLIQKENILMNDADGKNILQEDARFANRTMAKEAADADQLMGIFLLIAPITLLATLPNAAQKAADAQTVTSSINNNWLYDKSIYKNELHHAFVYFLVKDIVAVKGDVTLQVKIKELLSDNTYMFKFNIDTANIKNRVEEIRRKIEEGKKGEKKETY